MANKPHEGLVYPPLNQPQPPVPERVELENGMIVYLLEDHELPIIDISLRVRTGSIYEPADKSRFGRHHRDSHADRWNRGQNGAMNSMKFWRI